MVYMRVYIYPIGTAPVPYRAYDIKLTVPYIPEFYAGLVGRGWPYRFSPYLPYE